MLRVAIPLFTILLVMSPIGSGAMNNLWSAVAPDWHASPDTVALVTGVLNGVVSAVGCVVGYMTAFDGWVHDRFGTAWMLQAEALAALVCIVIALVVLRMINDRQSRASDVLLP